MRFFLCAYIYVMQTDIIVENKLFLGTYMFRNEWNMAIMVFLDQKCYAGGDKNLDTLDQIY